MPTRRDFNQKNGARAAETAGRPTGKDTPLPASPTISIDQPAREKAEGWITALAQEVTVVEMHLATLSGFFDEGLGKSIVGAMGLSAGEIREQIPALREALRDLDSDGPTPNSEVWS